MKKETISKIEEEINQKITLPNDIKEKVKKHVFTNIIIAISMIIYFTFLIIGSKETLKIVQSVHFNIFSIILLGITICLFEIAYKKDNVSLAIYGIETLVVSILTLFFPYIIFELDEFSKKYYMIVSAYIAVYYIIKSIWIVSKEKKIHVKQASDIKEIVKKEKRKNVTRVKEKTDIKKVDKPKKINEEKDVNGKTQKTIEEENVETIPKKGGRPKKTIEEKTKNTKTQKTEEKQNMETAPKKRGRPKKTVEEKTKSTKTQKIEEKQNVETAPKKRGRPKKTIEEKQANIEEQKTVEKEKVETTPKKRGRPRKVVTVDD